MKSGTLRRILLIGASLLVAMVLTILPLPHWAIWIRPQWVLLVVIYWSLALPERVSVGIAWMTGLFLDVLLGTLLGQHALALSVITYFTVKFHPRIRLFPDWQKVLVVFCLTMIYLAILYWIQGLMGQLPGTWMYWFPAISSALIWPWVFVLLRDYRRRFQVY